jgi:hypothetical protein
MTKALHCAVPSLKAALAAAVIAMAGCAGMMKTPTEQNIAGLTASGNVTITEDFVAGMGGGSGTLEYQGRSYPFRFVGTVAGPGGGVEKISASGPVSTSSPMSAILAADTRKAPARPVSALRAVATYGWRTVPA